MNDEITADVNVPEEGERSTEGESEQEYTSALDLLKRATAGSDLLAFNDIDKKDPYVQTSLKVGGFELSVKRKRRKR